MTDTAFLVVPFERVGARLSVSKAFVFPAVAPARAMAQQLAPRLPGVAVVERTVDPETGEDRDRLIAGIGAIPPSFPASASWSIALN